MRLSKSSMLKLRNYIEPLSKLDMYIEICTDYVGYSLSPTSTLIDYVPFNRAKYIFVRDLTDDHIYMQFNNINEFFQHFCYLRNH